MFKKQMILDWQIGESGDWDAFEPLEVTFETGTASRGSMGQGWRLGRLLRGLGLVALLAALVLGYRFWRDYQENITHIRTDIQGTVDLEAWAWQSDDEALAESLMDDQASDGWTRRFRWVQEWTRCWAGDEAQVPVAEIQNIELRGDLALVEAVVTEPGVPWMMTPYRETRFYRLVEDRWLRTAPDPAFWGRQRTIETEHFRFEFHQRDAEAVEAVAAEVDAQYAALRRDAGLGPPAADETLTIEVVPRTDVTYWRFTGERLMVPSPALLAVPEELPESVRLTHSIVRPLARRVLDEALQQTQVKSGWQPMVEGLRRWLGWDGNPLPSAWRYHAEGLLQERLAQRSPLRLIDLTAWGAGPWNRQNRWVQIMAAETLVDYAVTAYGRERLPALPGGLGQHETWDALMPAVFGVPAEEFEAGWQAYLAARYAPSTEAQAEERASQ